mgnify:FL=1
MRPIQTFSSIYKNEYGDVTTPYSFAEHMLNFLPVELYKNPLLRWCDPCAGQGTFALLLYEKLFIHLDESFPDPTQRKQHILEKMITVIELNGVYEDRLQNEFFGCPNIFTKTNFLSFQPKEKYNVILGNPPYNSNGGKKVPTNKSVAKKEDGTTLWIPFVKHAYSLLQDDGHLLMIFPSLWMKPDKAKMYDFMMAKRIERISTFTNTETNRIFHGCAQTPTCIYYGRNTNVANDHHMIPFVVNYTEPEKIYTYHHKIPKPIPLLGYSIASKLSHYIDKVGSMMDIIRKTNLPSSKIEIYKEFSSDNSERYQNIKSCLLSKSNEPFLVYDYSDTPLPYYGKSKLVLAHKMYGFPYYDKSGAYGISTRDNYVILTSERTHKHTHAQMCLLQSFLSTRFALFMYETTRYRMKFLEKYAFELIPNILRMHEFERYDKIDDCNIADIFNLSEDEREYINNFHRKKYGSFIDKMK